MTVKAFVHCFLRSVVPLVLLAGCAHQAATAPLPGVPPASQFRSDASGFRLLHTFKSRPDGARPQGRLTSLNGVLFGTTEYGGTADRGTVFQIQPDGTESVLHSFTGAYGDGESPFAGLLPRGAALYGTTFGGGSAYRGSAFEIKPDATLRTIYSFTKDTGIHPTGELTSVGGVFYGTTTNGGTADLGTVFALTPGGHYQLLHSFTGGADGSRPEGGVALLDHNFYGTTFDGGQYNFGTVFEISPDGSERVIYSFTGTNGDGDRPESELIAFNGALYGTTFGGGANGYGTIFEVKKNGAERIVHSLAHKEGYAPKAGLAELNGAFYGTATKGGASNVGSIFEVYPDGAFRVVHNFGLRDGSEPRAQLYAMNGKLYGTTYSGGSHYKGVVFEVTP